jgi:hypothetical protein
MALVTVVVDTASAVNSFHIDNNTAYLCCPLSAYLYSYSGSARQANLKFPALKVCWIHTKKSSRKIFFNEEPAISKQYN